MKQFFIKSVGGYYNLVSYLSKKFAANKAIYLFSTPRKGRKFNELQRDFFDTAFQEELKYDGNKIMTYRWLGKKSTILLAHGWESNSYRWKNLILELKRKGHNIIALDAPAHGKSGSSIFNAILYSEFIHVVANRFEPEIIIGHSVGGMSAVFCMKKYQLPYVKKIVLLGSPSEFTGVLKRYTDMLGYNQRITEQIDLTIIERFGQKPESFSTARFVKSLDVQGLIIHDELDGIIPYNDAVMIKESFKDSTLITTQGLGHSLNDASVAHHIYEFIET